MYIKNSGEIAKHSGETGETTSRAYTYRHTHTFIYIYIYILWESSRFPNLCYGQCGIRRRWLTSDASFTPVNLINFLMQ